MKKRLEATELVNILRMPLDDGQDEHIASVAQVDPEMAKVSSRWEKSHQQVSDMKLRRRDMPKEI